MREGTGLGNWTLFCPVYPMPLDLGMCGGFLMSATGMEQVSIAGAFIYSLQVVVIDGEE